MRTNRRWLRALLQVSAGVATATMAATTAVASVTASTPTFLQTLARPSQPAMYPSGLVRDATGNRLVVADPRYNRISGFQDAGVRAKRLPTTGRMLQRFAPTYMSKHPSAYSLADAVLIAQNYDLVVSNSSQFTNTNIPGMKAANPNVRILVYLNGSFDMFGNPNRNPTYPLSEYALDANGKYIESTKYHNWLMNVGDPNWAGSVSLHCSQLLASTSSFDGCFVDMLGDALLTGNYLTGQPINPATGAVWTNAQRMAVTALIGARVTADHPDDIVMGNGLNDGQRYFDSSAPTSQLLNGVNTALAETWLRQATMSVGKYRSPSIWQEEVNMLGDVGGRGDFDAVTTKVWSTATAAQITSWHRYALASFLLGTTGSSYFSFTQSQSSTEFQTDATSALDHTPTGAAVSQYQAAPAGAFTREFVQAEVIVNPSTKSMTVTLPKPCTTLDGGPPVSTLAMAAHTGQICSYASGGTPPTVTGISPRVGPDTGGTSVQITGTGFTPGSAVAFASTVAAHVVLNSSTQITATSPAGFGTVDVTVTNAAGTSAIVANDQFTYLPAVFSVLPAFGPAAGGTSVTITGIGFTSATGVTFGTTAATSFTVNTDTQITAISPAGGGVIDITVTTPGGTSATASSDLFTYGPVVSMVAPNIGGTAGGDLVTITGSGFTGATAVNFGTNSASSFTLVSDTEITVDSPQAIAGSVDVIVTTPAGTSPINPADEYTYQ